MSRPSIDLPTIRDAYADLIEANKSSLTSGLVMNGIGRTIKKIDTTPFELFTTNDLYHVAIWIPQMDDVGQAGGVISYIEGPVSIIVVDYVNQINLKQADDNFDTLAGRIADLIKNNDVTVNGKAFQVWPQDNNNYKPVQISKAAKRDLRTQQELRLGASITFTARGCV